MKVLARAKHTRKKIKRMRVLISSGPTREPIDSVRYLSNYSTGFMGSCLAEEALGRGHHVTVVYGPSNEALPEKCRGIPVEKTEEMAKALNQQVRFADALIMAAAVSDFRPILKLSQKIPRRKRVSLELKATKDIVARLPRKPGQIFAGFALETTNVLANAKRKLKSKRLNLVLAQQATEKNSSRKSRELPFGRKRVRAWLLESADKRFGRVKGSQIDVTDLGWLTKPKVARLLLDKIEALWYGQHK